MKKLAIIELILLGIIFILGGIFYYPIKAKYDEYKEMLRDISGDNYAEEIKMNIIINNNKYNVKLENNNTVKDLVNLLPLDIEMKYLNSNEKYYYLEKNITSNPTNIKRINKGDIMLYRDNCLVLFYKSFDTTYNYTKIGTLDNTEVLDNLDNNIKVRLERG